MTGVLDADVETPAVIVDLTTVERNVAAAQAVCDDHGVRLRPHAKTHKSPFFAGLQLGAGACGLTVAKLDEAEVFADAGMLDLLIAYPIVGESKVRRLVELSQRARLAVTLDSVAVAKGLDAAFAELEAPIDVFIEVNTGLDRVGLLPGKETIDLVLAVRDFPGLNVRGLLTHWDAGNEKTVEGRRAAAAHEGGALADTARRLAEIGVGGLEVSVGSTPSLRHVVTVPGVDEARPGTYIFNDVDMVMAGAATLDDCALVVWATVVSRPTATRAVVDAGSKTLSSDAARNTSGFGRVVDLEATVTRLNEEHGILEVPADSQLSVGDKVGIIPNHVCQVINLSDAVLLRRPDGSLAEIPIAARGKRR